MRGAGPVILFLAMMLVYAVDLTAVELPQTVRVRILNIHHPASIRVSVIDGKIFLPGGIETFTGSCTISLSGKSIVCAMNGRIIPADMARIQADRIRIESAAGSRTYEGAVEISADDKELCAVNAASLESYVHAAALSEAGELLGKDAAAVPGWEMELLAAMEICIRSYIVSNGKRHDDGRYSFCDLTHCVHFTGIAGGVSVSAGTVLTDKKGNVCGGFFHSACGGKLTHPSVFWGGASSECFREGDDSLDGRLSCGESPHANWKAFVKSSAMDEFFGCRVLSIRTQLNEGRVEAMIAETHGAEKKLSAASFLSFAGKKLGWNIIKSNDFTVTKTDAGFRFEGRGLGHGIGLCQYGAAARAKKGWKAERILQFYFPGTKLESEKMK